MGHVYQRGQSLFIDYTDANGLRIRDKVVEIVEGNKDAAKEKAKEILAQRLNAVADTKAGITRVDQTAIRLDDLAKKYLASRKPHIIERHYKQTESILTHFQTETGVVFVSGLNREVVESYLNRMNEDKKAGRTQNHHLQTVKGLLSWAAEMGEIQSNPIANIPYRPQHEQKKRRRELTVKEIGALLQAAKRPDAEPWEYPAYILAIYAGMREIDITRLKWRQIDLENETWSVRAEDDKSHRARLLPLHWRLVQALRELWERRPGMPETPVVALPHSHVVDFLKNTLRYAEIPYSTPITDVDMHSLRHTFITLLDRSGCPEKELCTLARHADKSFTRRVYVHNDLERMRDALNKLPDFEVITTAQTAVKEGTNDADMGDDEPPRGGPSGGRNIEENGNLGTNPSQNPESVSINSDGYNTCDEMETSLQSAPFDHLGISPSKNKERNDSATKRIVNNLDTPSSSENQKPENAQERTEKQGNEPLLAQISHKNLPADLAAIVAAWDLLPAAVKAGMLAMVKASSGKGV